MVNRKLVRPNLSQIKDRLAEQGPGQENSPRSAGQATPGPGRRRPAPAEQTNAEAFYYLKQMNTQTPMCILLDNGEELEGCIEWYDRTCLKVHRENGPNLLVFKHCIRYLYKAEDKTT